MHANSLMLDKDLSLSIGARDVTTRTNTELMIEVEFAGLCGSDLHVLKSGDWVEYWPATLGHEVCGLVRSGENDEFPPGTRVIVDSRMPRIGKTGAITADRFDPELRWLGEARPGGFAQFVSTEAVTLHRVPESVPAEVAVLAEPLAVVSCAVDRVSGLKPESILVLGFGPIGFFAMTELRRRWPAARLVVTEPNPARREHAAHLGCESTATLPGETFDLVVDAAGYRTSLTDALDVTRRGGTILLLALGHNHVEILPSDIVERGLMLVGNVGFDTTDLDSALALLSRDVELYRKVVTHVVPLEDLPEFLHSAEFETSSKVLVDCGGAR